MSHPKQERNNEMWEDKKKMSWSKLAIKYRLSTSACRDVIMRETIRRLKAAQ